jgi:hypothetical protein
MKTVTLHTHNGQQPNGGKLRASGVGPDTKSPAVGLSTHGGLNQE